MTTQPKRPALFAPSLTKDEKRLRLRARRLRESEPQFAPERPTSEPLLQLTGAARAFQQGRTGRMAPDLTPEQQDALRSGAPVSELQRLGLTETRAQRGPGVSPLEARANILGALRGGIVGAAESVIPGEQDFERRLREAQERGEARPVALRREFEEAPLPTTGPFPVLPFRVPLPGRTAEGERRSFQEIQLGVKGGVALAADDINLLLAGPPGRFIGELGGAAVGAALRGAGAAARPIIRTTTRGAERGIQAGLKLLPGETRPALAAGEEAAEQAAQRLPSGRVPGGPRAEPRGVLPPEGPPRPPTEVGGGPPELPSGRRPGGPGREPPEPPRDPYQQLQAALSPEREPLVSRVVSRLPQEFYDRNFPLKDLERQTGIPAHQLAQVVPGAATAGEDVIRRLYLPIIKTIQKDVANLEEYMVLKRMEDILARNPDARLPGGVGGEGFTGWNGVLRAQDKLRAKIGAERYAALEQAGSDLWRLNDEQNLQALRAEGILSSEAYTAIKSAHPHYIPFTRADFVEDMAKGFSRPRGEASVSSTGIRKMGLEGSDRALDRPLQRLLSEAIKTKEVIFHNRAARSTVEALEEMQRRTGEDLVRYIDPKREMRVAERVTGEVKPRLRKGEHSADWETISFYRDGVKNTVDVPAVFGRVAKGLEGEPDNIALKVARVVNAPLRLGATQYNPFFLPVNVMRDAMGALFREKVFPFGPDYLAGMWSAIRKNATFEEAAQSGVLMSGIVENMRGPTSALSRAKLGGIQLSNPADALLLIPRLISEANIIAERGVRLGTFRQLRRAGSGQLEAAVRARDVTVDFAKSGHFMRVINQIVPFSNPAVQGSANIIRTVANNPKRSLAFGALFMTPTVMARVNNMRFETSELIPDYEYTRNWVVQLGEGTRKDGTKFPIYVKIPKGEIAGMFTFPAEALFNLARQSEDRSAVELLLESARDQVSNISPIDIPIVGRGGIGSALSSVPIVGTAVGVGTNVDPFTGAPIVPRREENLLPEQQFGAETSAVAVELGRRFKVSPRLIDFAIKDFTAGAGQSLNWLAGMALEALGLQPETFGQAVAEPQPEGVEATSRVPGVSRFLGTRGTQQERRGWAQFDAAVEETNRAFSQLPDMNRLGVRLGSAPDSIGSQELTPAQRAEYQAIMASVVTDGIEPFMTRLSEKALSDDQRRTAVQKAMNALKDRARAQAVRQILSPKSKREPLQPLLKPRRRELAAP